MVSLDRRAESDTFFFGRRTRAVVPEGIWFTSVNAAAVPHSSAHDVVNCLFACQSSRFVPDSSLFDSHIIPMRRDITGLMTLVSERMSVIAGLLFHIIAVITHITARVSVITALMSRITREKSVMTAQRIDITGDVSVVIRIVWHINRDTWLISGGMWQTKNELWNVIGELIGG